jgi:hypothetical protein
VWTWLLAQTEGIGDSAWEIFGAFAFIVVALGWFSRMMLLRVLAENKTLTEQREEMIRTLLQVVPLITEATAVLKERQAIDEEVVQCVEKTNKTQETVASELNALRRAFWSGPPRSGSES